MLPLWSPDPAHIDPLWVLLGALVLDAAMGDPAWLYRHLPHPVALLGGFIGALDRRMNRDGAPEAVRRALGIVAVLVAVALAGGIGVLIAAEAAALKHGELIVLALTALLLAQRSLGEHVADVARALETGGLAAGRAAVRHIVGRDPESLDEAGVARAAIESMAENFSDGVVAPVFWFLLLGLPGICAYKAVNTLDSMIGHRSERHRAFGWAAARLDDLANLLPARIAAVLLSLAALLLPGGRAQAALRSAWRDAPRHRSPNAGWPEAATAGALGLALAGPRRYGGRVVEDAWMGKGRRTAGAADIRRALRLYAIACAIEAALIAALALARSLL